MLMIVPLKLHDVTAVDKLTRPQQDQKITLQSPALSVLTDFKQYQPFHLNHKTTAKEARLIMENAHARLRFVVDDASGFLGVVTLDDLSEQKMIQKMAAGHREHEILVTDFMQDRNQLKAFDYTELCRAKIIDVIETLKSKRQKHCLVVDRDSHEIRGIISGSDIGRALDMPININRESTFIDIAQAILSSMDH
ncbi:hypothetical protein GCM10011365_21060 [Marinicella pacifica]|uniref:CBS domain-containing protein n=2 Tax=Marinicella pacifica TaxID=1171543 RepID=A0A917FT52_9GAMM|nr:hypothetical protein GCM10011365_21060 [Marinicella pacifica]